MGKEAFTGEDATGPLSFVERAPEVGRALSDGISFLRVSLRIFLFSIDFFPAGFLFSVAMTLSPSAGWLAGKLPPEGLSALQGGVSDCFTPSADSGALIPGRYRFEGQIW
jgi:hypothetical protein